MAYDDTTPIIGSGTVSADAITAWFNQRGPAYAATYAPDKQFKPCPPDLGMAIIVECAGYASMGYRVNHDLAAAQILHETAAWQSKYARERNNPGGLGAVNGDEDLAIWFDSVQAGVEAHVAHMLVYAAGDGPWSVDDPRLGPVVQKGWLGSAPRLVDLNGKWAYPGKTYGQSIANLANQLVDFANNGSWVSEAQIPGFIWHPAGSDHYDVGRTQKIRGGAQHYTAGTNSLAWLTTTSKPPVSATFLVKHEPTLDDRGWQLVRIENTAWTTAMANPYTVSIEYEHKVGQPIPDIAYTVLAQTWADIARYVRREGLGEITSILGHKEWVNNPSLVCPDGIDITRIQREWVRLMADPTPPADDAIHLNGFKIVQGFKGFWQELANYEPTLPYRVLGLPLENEHSPGPGRALQRFERGWLKWDEQEPPPYHIHLRPLSEMETP